MSHSLPVAKALQPIIPDGVLVRGRTVLCSGDAAMSTALLVVSAATQAGSWLAVVGVSDFGLVSACEQGVALQRTVLVTPTSNKKDWTSTVAAVADGFDVVMLEVPREVSESDARRIQTRIQARRNVLVLVETPRHTTLRSVFQPDVVLHTVTTKWDGIEHGAGYVQGRLIDVTVSGRRVPRAMQHVLQHVG
jgi:galactose-1-phosphate uridylyltransferase